MRRGGQIRKFLAKRDRPRMTTSRLHDPRDIGTTTKTTPQLLVVSDTTTYFLPPTPTPSHLVVYNKRTGRQAGKQSILFSLFSDSTEGHALPLMHRHVPTFSVVQSKSLQLAPHPPQTHSSLFHILQGRRYMCVSNV